MIRSKFVLGIAAVLVGLSPLGRADEEDSSPALDALKPIQVLIGDWRGAAAPRGRTPGWVESVRWVWRFQKGKAVGLVMKVEKGKFFKAALLSYDPGTEKYMMTVTTKDDETEKYQGQLKTTGSVSSDEFSDKPKPSALVLTSHDEERDLDKRITIRFQYQHRYLLEIESKSHTRRTYSKLATIGCTRTEEVARLEKEGDVPQGPKCILTGGAGTIAVNYKGATYYVCCSGCRDEFLENPEKYIAKAAKKAAAQE